MKEDRKIATREVSKKEECTFGRHGWLWASISLLVLSQVTSFFYLIQAQQHLIDNCNTGLRCSCPQPDDGRSFTSSSNSSVGEADPPERIYAADRQLHFANLARKKRSSPTNKTVRHSHKVS